VFKERHKKLEHACVSAFTHTYAESRQRPSLSISYHYGFPAFEIAFQTRQQRDEAAGLNASFVEAIQTLCDGLATPGNPFDARKAIAFTYPGHGAELLANIRSRK
jgi:hypothetical protein